ncbi:MAG: hypothetical protein IJS15_09815 [Victivallales bacterium]|nr:hypothetical protein [Victivallales bacterium]
MNKAIIIMGMTLSAAICQAASTSNDETSEEIEMRMFGGYIRKANSAKGKVVVLNAQKRIPKKDLFTAVEKIMLDIRPEVEWKDVSDAPLPNPQTAIKAAGGNVGVVLVDDVHYPSLLTAPEDGWAIVNAAALAADKPDSTKLAARIRKEILRGFALVAGCSFMARGPFVLRPNIRKPSDLDFIKEECYGVDAIGTLAYSLRYYGITPWLVTTYENACAFGWAPAPTNDFQKAIWDKVHAIPKNPMKIEFDPKKGR